LAANPLKILLHSYMPQGEDISHSKNISVMKQKWMSVPVIALSMTALMFSCNKTPLLEDNSPIAALSMNAKQSNTFYGPQVNMGDGKARSFIVMEKSGMPVELGYEMTQGAMFNLPQDPHDFGASTYLIPLHQKAQEATAFDHLVINWNINGHEPPGLFDIRHFDFHLYMMPLAQRLAIPPYQINPTGFDNLPAPSSWPAGFVPTPEGVPAMGKHWISMSFAPPFTHTMIYGSYAGQFTFMEPMITRAFMMSGANVSVPYSPLNGFPVLGKWYPQTYNIYNAAGKHYVSLSNFSLH